MAVIALAALALTAGCAFTPASAPARVPPTPTTVRVVQTTPVPTVERRLQAVPTLAIDNTPDPSATRVPACEGTAALPPASHVVRATLAYREQVVDVEQDIRYVNHGNDALEQLALVVEPNLRPGAFRLDTLTVDALPAPEYALTGRELLVDLPAPLGAGCPLDLTLAYHLRVPLINPQDYTGYFGFSARQINLAHWLVTPGVRRDGEWLVHDSAPVGEQTVAEPGDWDVTLAVDGASERLQVVGPGEASGPNDDHWHFILRDSRDFSVSMSERFHRAVRETESGVTVELYTFDDAAVATPNGGPDGAAHALDSAARAVATFSDLFGPYPHRRLLIVQGDFPDGMEFGDLVFVSTHWFQTYGGDPASYLTLITVHEVAHQWWYARVGNDQALVPWLDEALATYSEYLFLERHYPDLTDWWWTFRVNQWIPESYDDRSVASTVYEFDSVRSYINAVYLRGARMLRDLRADLGSAAFLTWLRAYADAGSGRIVTPDLFWSLLTPEQLDSTRETRERYLSG